MSSCREEDELLPRSSPRSFPHMSIYGLAIRHGSLVHRGSFQFDSPRTGYRFHRRSGVFIVLFCYAQTDEILSCVYTQYCIHGKSEQTLFWGNRIREETINPWITWISCSSGVSVCSIVINLPRRMVIQCVSFIIAQSRYLQLLWNEQKGEWTLKYLKPGLINGELTWLILIFLFLQLFKNWTGLYFKCIIIYYIIYWIKYKSF